MLPYSDAHCAYKTLASVSANVDRLACSTTLACPATNVFKVALF